MPINQISLNPSLIARILGAVAFLLCLASLLCDLLGYLIFGEIHVPFRYFFYFYVEAERNVPTVFSIFLLLFAALLLSVITMLKRKQTSPETSHWAILSLGFLFMAADEGFSYHERLIMPMQQLLGNANLGLFYHAWIIPGIILILVLVPFFLKFLLRLPAKTRLTFLTSFTIYIAGAIGLEAIGGRQAELYGVKNWTYRIINTAEEGFEMAGVIIFIWALLVYIADNYKEVQLRFE